MCGRFTLVAEPDAVAEFFELSTPPDFSPRYNIAPTQPAPVIVAGTDGSRLFRTMRWGLIPSWAKDPTIGAKMINARAETVAEKPAFRSAFKHRRCLIAADGFYEWKKLPRGKQPFYIRMKDGGPFALAGLWERWESPQDSPIESCSIITTTPNDLVAGIHDRMPVILGAENHAAWLDPEDKKTEPLSALLLPYPAIAMKAFAVSTRVNSPSNDDPACIQSL